MMCFQHLSLIFAHDNIAFCCLHWSLKVKSPHSPIRGYLIHSFVAFNVFPNFFHHIESTSSSLLIAMRKAGISSLRSSSEPKLLNFLMNRERS